IQAAIEFYPSVWDWRAERADEASDFYTWHCAGATFGALYQIPEPLTAAKVTPTWLNYIAVDDIEITLAAVDAKGGAVVLGPVTVGSAGKMAMVKDPEGALFALWQPLEHFGAVAQQVAGRFCWQEVASRSREQAIEFYQGVFGWDIQVEKHAMGERYIFCQHNKPVASIIQMTAEWGDTPSHWMTYFASADIDADLAQIEALGGQVCVPAFDMPDVGRIAVVGDPAGVYFSLLATD
ncbi:MAG: VOC family protein, partial [Gammaproteobacteria bacterium]|nr:VOC family protein [Gammaproteobacteria bacterium]